MEDVSEEVLGFKRELLDKCDVSSSELPFLIEDVGRSLQIARYMRHYIRGLLYLTQNLKAPSGVKVFAWLMHKSKHLTQDRLFRSGWTTSKACALCDTTQTETHQNLSSQCTFAKNIWAKACRMKLHLEQSSNMMALWKDTSKRLDPTIKQEWGSLLLVNLENT